LSRLGDEAVCQQALDDAVEVAGIQRDQSVRVRSDGLYETIAMALRVGKGEKHLEIDRFEWQIQA
jgi:hypothetical protein